jgi:hypothetical protein
MLPSQTEANRLVGRLAAVANRKYSEVNLDFSGNYREIFSPADQQWTDLGSIFASTLKANLRGFDDLDDILVVPRQVTHRHDNRTGYTSVSAIFDVEAPVELTGVTITPPEVPSEDPGDDTWDQPDPPEWPTYPEIVFTGSLLAFDDAEGCWLRLPDAADWEERNGARTGTDDDDNQGGWDPWWFTPAKQNTTNPNSSILWACQDGKIWRSTDGGTSWLDATPGDDPPNDWGDAVAPTVADVTFIQRTDNIHQNKAHYFTAEWQEAGGDWRGWLLVTEDDGVTWSWYGLTPLVIEGDWVYGQYTGTSVGCVTAGTQANINEEDSVYTHFSAAAACAWDGRIEIDFGINLNANARFKWRAYKTSNGQPPANSCYLAIPALPQGGVGDLKWFENGVDPDDGTVYEHTTAKNYGSASPLMYINHRSFPGFPGDNDHQGWIDYVAVNATDLGATQAASRPIWMDVDSEDGGTLYLTIWNGNTDTLELWVYDTSNFAASSSRTSLGSCTIAQLNALTYVAYPHTPAFSSDYVYCFGRMNAPDGLANPEHVIVSTDGGASFASVENGWGADYCGAFRAEGTTDGARTFYGIRNIAAAAAKLHVGPETLTYRIDTAFVAGVYVDALTVNPAGQVAVGSDGTNDIEIIADPWASWTDITDSYPGAATNSLTYL